MANAFVQAASKTTTSAVTSLTTDAITTTSGNLIVVGHAISEPTSPYQAAITDSKSNTYVDNHSFAHNGAGSFDVSATVAYAKNITGGASHTFTITPVGSQYVTIGACEFSGADTTAPADTAKPATTGNSGACNPGTLTPASSGDLYVTVGTHSYPGSDPTYTAAAGFTKRVEIGPNSNNQIPLVVTAQDSASGSQTGTITISLSSQWAAASATFIAAAGGAATWGQLLGLRNNRLVNVTT